MKILNSYDNLNKILTAVALGNFDGLHMGHLKIVNSTVEYARKHNLKSIVHMYDKNPMNAIRDNADTKMLATIEKRAEILADLGVDYVMIQEFNRQFAKISPEDFVTNYIYEKMNAKFVCVGYNYTFGAGAMGDNRLLKNLCANLGIQVSVIPSVEFGGHTVSSSRIRNLLLDGDINTANKLLMREYSIRGQVAAGEKLGRSIGFPTANIKMESEVLLPQCGVYATKCKALGTEYYSMTNIGAKPTVNINDIMIETNIFDFDGDLYNKTIEISFCGKIRNIKRFGSVEELKAQLMLDKAAILKYFSVKNG